MSALTSEDDSFTTVAAPAPAALNGIGYENVAASAGLNYVWPTLPRPLRNLEAFGTGCAFLDYDDDGWQDILLVAHPYCRLYRNLHNGHFEDVTARVGLTQVKGYWTGCAVGDYDGDGRLDILLTGYRCLALLRNDPQKGLVDRTVAAGLDPHNRGHWGSSAGFMDIAGKGRMDLVILNYVTFGPHETQYCHPAPGVTTGCPPASIAPNSGRCGKMSATDVSAKCLPPLILIQSPILGPELRIREPRILE